MGNSEGRQGWPADCQPARKGGRGTTEGARVQSAERMAAAEGAAERGAGHQTRATNKKQQQTGSMQTAVHVTQVMVGAASGHSGRGGGGAHSPCHLSCLPGVPRAAGWLHSPGTSSVVPSWAVPGPPPAHSALSPCSRGMGMGCTHVAGKGRWDWGSGPVALKELF